jgi:thiamine biosynthesis protein ThiI
MKYILLHFGELALKGKNRGQFERQLANNIKRLLHPVSIQRDYGRMLLEFEQVDEALLEHLALIPGIRNFSLVHQAELTLESVQEVAVEAVKEAFGDAEGSVAGKLFKVSARRGDKSFAMTSPELNFEVGGYLKTQLDLVVSLHHPEITVHVEVTKDGAYIYTDRRQAIGGLPVGSSGKGVVLFSGGIDSPVAAFTMMKRGMEVVLVHLYNSSINRDFAKIKDLAKQLSRYQGYTRLYLIDLEEFQRHAIAEVPADYRMIIYKRQMIRTAGLIAAEENAKALITGDSLGQVASQTLDNINAIYDASSLPLLPPLIGMDKEDIIKIARKIGTYEISIEEYCDICSFLIAKHPETHGKRTEVAKLEARLPLEGLESTTRMHVFIGGNEKPDLQVG